MTRAPTRTRARSWGLVLLGGALLVAFAWRQRHEFTPSSYIDLRVYREGVRSWWAGGSAYSQPLVPEGLLFTYPPVSLVALAAFALPPFAVVAVLLVLIDVAALAAVLLVLRRVLGPERLRPPVVLVLLGLGLWLEPLRNTVDYGQVNIVLLLLVVGDALFVPPRWRGVGMGLAAAVKIVPAIFVLYLLVTGQRRAAGVMVAAALGATGLGALLMPRDSWRYWSGYLLDTDRVGKLAYTSNQSVRGALVRVLGPGLPATLGWLVLSVAVLGVAGLAIAGARARRWPVSALAACGLASLLVAPISWSHHWVWLVLAALAVAVEVRMTLARGAAMLTVLATAVAPHWLLPQGGEPELSWSGPQQLAGSAYPLAALALLVVIAVGARRGAAPQVDGARSSAAASSKGAAASPSTRSPSGRL